MTLLYTLKKIGTFSSWVFYPLFGDTLDLQTFLFKLTTKTQAPKVMEEPKDEKPIIKLWFQLATKKLFLVHRFEFIKLFQSTIVW
jgi:hypothetical protein